jgi:cell division protein FtsW
LPIVTRKLTADIEREASAVAPYDFALLASVVLLLGLGTVMVYASTINDSTMLSGDGAARLKVHMGHVGLGIAVLVFSMFFPYRRWRTLVYPALLATVVLLVLVMLFGKTAGNARRWISLPGFSLQPAELAKLAFVIFLAYSISKKSTDIRRFGPGFGPHLAVCGMLIVLCLFQPDFGTCIILVLLMFGMLFAAGTKLSYITLFVCIGAFLAFQAIATNDMRLGRVMAFIDPWAYRTGTGYQMVNSLIAIGSGGIVGQGIGYGGQTLTGFLPEGHTDFILSVIAEQLGLVGVMIVILLFTTILIRGVKIALAARDDFGRFLAFGVTLLITVQAAINMLVCVALIPTKGLTLPFVSYGGSSMVVCCLALGILLSISRDERIGEFEAIVPSWAREKEDEPTPKMKKKRRQQGKRKLLSSKPQNLDEVLK